MLRVEPHNSFTLRSPTGRAHGWVMYPHVSYLNHSCMPCVAAVADGNTMVVEALRDVTRGEELTICYLRLDAADDDGHGTSVWGFNCGCGRCDGSASAEALHEFDAAFRCPCGCITTRRKIEAGCGKCVCHEHSRVPQTLEVVGGAPCADTTAAHVEQAACSADETSSAPPPSPPPPSPPSSPPPPQALETRPLTPNDLAAAASLTSHAFFSSPSYKAIVPDDQQRGAFLQWLFERNYWLRLGSHSGYCVFDREELVMFFMLEMPDLPRLSLWDMLRAGLAMGFLLHGVGAMRRLLETKAWFEAREREALGERAGTVARIERVTVLPDRQGQGVGSAALRAALREADEMGLAVFLATQEERNVRFYARLGFEVIVDEVCPIGEGYRSWMMLREPGGGE